MYLKRMEEGGVGLQFYTVGGDFVMFSGEPDLRQGTYRRIDIVLEAVDGTNVVIIRSPDDLEGVRAQRTRGLVLTIEGALPLGGEDFSTLRNLHRLGLRSICLHSYIANQVGDGVGEPRQGGLTSFGRRLVNEMNRLGMVIDITQSAPQVVSDVLEISDAPVVASHSNAAALYPHVRNLSDEHIRAIAQGGGLIGLTSYPGHIKDGPATLSDFLRHIDYVVNLVGPDHACFGLNIVPPGTQEEAAGYFTRNQFAFTNFWLEGLEDITRLPEVLDVLAKLGYDEETVAKIAGTNILRVLQDVLSRPAMRASE